VCSSDLAQELGYTEPDPRDDLGGVDFMRKMLILARDAGYALEVEDVELENILPASCLEAKSVDEFYTELLRAEDYFNEMKQKAESDNKVIRYIGAMEEGKVHIRLQYVDDQRSEERRVGKECRSGWLAEPVD